MDMLPREAEDRLSEVTVGVVGAALRRENLRRNVLAVSHRAGRGGEFGGERGVISTDNVGVKEMGEKSGAQSILPTVD